MRALFAAFKLMDVKIEPYAVTS